MYRLTTTYSVTGRQTDNNIMPIANNTLFQRILAH